jgi:hypothetical protein
MEQLLVDLRCVLPTSGDDSSSSDQIPTYIIDHFLIVNVVATPSEVAREVLSRLELAGTLNLL